MGPELLLIFFLIVANGLFSMAEIAIVSSRKSKLEAAAKKGDKRAKLALKLHNEPTRFLSTVQVGITLIGILTGIFSGQEVTEELTLVVQTIPGLEAYAHAIAFVSVVAVVTLLSILFGELVPKQIGLNNPEKIARLVSQPMQVVSGIVNPFVWILSSLTRMFVRLLRLKPNEEPSITEEEIKSLVAQGALGGDVEEVENDIIQRVFNLGDRKVGSLMTNRLDLEWIDLLDEPEHNRERILAAEYSSIPVCEEGIDTVVGILHTKKFFRALSESPEVHLKELVEAPLYIPENMTAFNLLEKFRELKTKVAIVIDEYGAVQGMVTMTDLIDALVGEMDVSTTPEDTEIVERADGSFLIDALIPFDEFVGYFEIEEEVEDEDTSGFHTLGGFILHLNEQIPHVGEVFEWKHFSFEVVDMDGNRIDKLLVRNTKTAHEGEEG